jgi:hypothetical protein
MTAYEGKCGRDVSEQRNPRYRRGLYCHVCPDRARGLIIRTTR